MSTCRIAGVCPSVEQEDGFFVATLALRDRTEYHITIPLADVGVEPACAALRRFLTGHAAVPVAADVFGLAASDAGALAERAVGSGCPVTWIEDMGREPNGGILVWAVSGAEVETICVGGRVVGAAFSGDGARYCRLGGLTPEDLDTDRPEQARRVFDLMLEALGAAGMAFDHVVRTWFYNDDILGWYGDFNKVRTDFFRAHHVFDGMVPASTGIGGPNGRKAALMAGLLAMRSDSGLVEARPLASPLQCPALNYGSSFSRAAEITAPGLRRVLVSGTASIAPEGHTVHLDDVDAQTRLTMDVIHAILESCGMGWEHTTRAIAYVKPGEDAACIQRWLKANEIDVFPMVTTVNTVCRDDLLFELELDAAIMDAPPA